MKFRVLGTVGVIDGGRPLTIGSVQQRRLLGLLLVDAGSVVPVERIIDALWSDSRGPASPESALHTYVSRLRGSLGDRRIVRHPNGYAIELRADALDADRFEPLILEARDRPPSEALGCLDDALALWPGFDPAPAFGVFASEPWALGASARLGGLRLAAMEDHFGARIAVGAHREVIADLHRAVAAHPERSHLVGHLMVALHRRTHKRMR